MALIRPARKVSIEQPNANSLYTPMAQPIHLGESNLSTIELQGAQPDKTGYGSSNPDLGSRPRLGALTRKALSK